MTAPGDPDEIELQPDYAPAIAAARAEAAKARAALLARLREQEGEYLARQSRARRAKDAVEQQRETAEAEAKESREIAADFLEHAARADAEAAAADARGDGPAAEEARENAEALRIRAATREEQARVADADVVALGAQVADAGRDLQEVEDAWLAEFGRYRPAEAEIDKLDARVRMLEDADAAYRRADLATDPTEAARHVAAAEQLVRQADAVVLDAAALRAVDPGFRPVEPADPIDPIDAIDPAEPVQPAESEATEPEATELDVDSTAEPEAASFDLTGEPEPATAFDGDLTAYDDGYEPAGYDDLDDGGYDDPAIELDTAGEDLFDG